jgi:hypothetical protein
VTGTCYPTAYEQPDRTRKQGYGFSNLLGAPNKADRLKKGRSSESTVETTLGRAQKAENLADEIATKLRKLHDLKDQGKV